ncbi:MAG TPA: MarR family transcriptional regulator, partial [Phenylobacterium sp.]
QENGATQRRLAQLNNVTEPTAVTLLASMERLDLIRRERNVADRRKVNVFLTPKADALKAQLMPMAHRINDIAGAGIAPDELATCLSVLERMSENLTAEATRLSDAARQP